MAGPGAPSKLGTWWGHIGATNYQIAADNTGPTGLHRRSSVGEGERVHDRAILDREGGQLVDQAALLSLEARPGVMGDKASQPLLAMVTKELGAIDWMEAKSVQGRGIADVMQERRR